MIAFYLMFFPWMPHILLGRQCQFDRRVIHDGTMNTYQFDKDGKKFQLHPLRDKVDEAGNGTILAYVKRVEQQDRE